MFQRCQADAMLQAHAPVHAVAARSPHALPHRNLEASQGQFKFNPLRRGRYFAALYIKYQNECAGEQRIRLATSRSRVRVPAVVQLKHRGLRETKQPPRRAKQQHTGLQAYRPAQAYAAQQNRAYGLRSPEQSTCATCLSR